MCKKLSRFEVAFVGDLELNTYIRCTKGVHPHNQYEVIVQNLSVGHRVRLGVGLGIHYLTFKELELVLEGIHPHL